MHRGRPRSGRPGSGSSPSRSALPYGLLLLGVVIGLEAPFSDPLLETLTAIVLVAGVAAVRTGGAGSNEPAGRVGRALWAGAIGAASAACSWATRAWAGEYTGPSRR